MRARAQGDPRAVSGICVDLPPPILSMFPDLREIEIGDAVVTLRFDSNGQKVERVVRLGETEHPAGVGPSLLGHAIGSWEGETLVVDTVAFTPHDRGLVARGALSGPNKHLVERLTLTDDRRRLRYDVTLEDLDNMTGPATYSMLWDHRPDLEPSGVPCDPEVAGRFLDETAAR